MGSLADILKLAKKQNNNTIVIHFQSKVQIAIEGLTSKKFAQALSNKEKSKQKGTTIGEPLKYKKTYQSCIKQARSWSTRGSKWKIYIIPLRATPCERSEQGSLLKSGTKNFTHLYAVEVCVPELVSNETRQDETGHHFPNWRYREKTTFFWSRCSRKSGKNLGKKKIRVQKIKKFPKNYFSKINTTACSPGAFIRGSMNPALKLQGYK